MQAFQQCRISRNFDQLLELSKANIILKLRGTLAIISDVILFIFLLLLLLLLLLSLVHKEALKPLSFHVCF